MTRYRRMLVSRRRLTDLEIIGCLIAVALFLLAGFMFVMACWATLSAHMRTEAKITTDQAWTASLVVSLLALTVCDLLSDVFLHARSMNTHAAGSVGPLWFDWDLTFSVVGLFWVWLSYRLWRRR